MPEIYGFEYDVAQRLKELAGLPTQVSKARTEPLRRPQLISSTSDKFVTFNFNQLAPTGGTSLMETGYRVDYTGRVNPANPDTYAPVGTATGAAIEVIDIGSGDHRIQFGETGYWMMHLSFWAQFSLTFSLQINSLVSWDVIPEFASSNLIDDQNPGRRTGVAPTPVPFCGGEFVRHLKVSAATNYKFGWRMNASRHYTVTTNATLQLSPPIIFFNGALTLQRIE